MDDIYINRYESLCCKGSAEYNEDIVGYTSKAAWVLDGATGLNKKKLVSKQSDAKWYVNWWNEYLYQNIHKEKNLKEIIKEGISKIIRDYQEALGNNEISELDKPSSSICIIKIHEDKIEYLILGDCALHIKIDETVSILTDDKLCNLDANVYKKMSGIRNLLNLSHEEIKEEVMDVIIENRLKKNTQEGYWILEFEEEAVDNSIYGNINIHKEASIMLVSDGYSCVSTRYKLIEEKKLIEEVEEQGVSRIYFKLREFEEEKSSIYKYPRFKVKDDSSCVYLDINTN